MCDDIIQIFENAGVSLPNENSLGEKIVPDDDPVKIQNFWNWFGDSKVVDEQGRPMVVYHGTQSEFNSFRPAKRGIYFASLKRKEEVAGYYAQGKGKILACYLKMENPFIGNPSEVYEMKEKKEKNEKINCDGLISIKDFKSTNKFYNYQTDKLDEVTLEIGDIVEIVVFEPTQIKSIQNNGLFSLATNNIYESIEYAEMLEDGNMFEVHKNPSDKEFWDLMRNSHSKMLRVFVGAKDCYVWDGYVRTHDEIDFHLNDYFSNHVYEYAQVYCYPTWISESEFNKHHLYRWFVEKYYADVTFKEPEKKPAYELQDKPNDNINWDEVFNELEELDKSLLKKDIK